MKMGALITIGMPVYNCESTVAESIASIINQGFKDWELIVYDDGSRDGTVAMARRFNDARIRIVEGGKNCGLPACLNTIIAGCESEFFARMDGDDIAYPDRLQAQLDFLRGHTDVDMVAGSILVFRSDGAAIGVRRGAETHEKICLRPWADIPMAHPTWMGRSEWFRRNAYDGNMMRMEDWELLFRTYRHSRFANLPEIVQGYREDSLSLRKILVARRYKCFVMLRRVWEERTLWRAFSSILGQIARSLVDITAIVSNLNYRLLKHRIPPVYPGETTVWKDVLEKTRDTVLAQIGVESERLDARPMRRTDSRVDHMKLLVSMDEHYLRGSGGSIYSSEGTTSYALWKSYLKVFSHVIVLARVKDERAAGKLRAEARADGEGVSFYPLPDFRGPWAYLRNRRGVIQAVNRAVEEADAYLLRGGDLIGGALAQILYKRRLPYALQVIGDPWEVFGMGGVGGVLRPALRLYATWELRSICRKAMAVSYVSRETLQKRYPASVGAFKTGYSNVQLKGALLDDRQLSERIGSLEKIGERKPKLGFIGSLEQPYKGADVLLRALARCARQGVTLTCDLVGEGKLRSQYEALAVQLGLDGTVRFLGRLSAGEAIFRFLDSVDLFVMPSLTEGLPRAMVEAMARGCPAIGSRVGGIPELLSEDCLFPARDHQRLAQVLLSKLNPEELCRMARMNLATARDYAPEFMEKKQMEFLEEIMARSAHDNSHPQVCFERNA